MSFNCSYMARSSLTYITVFSNSSHLEWRVGLSDTILKGNHPGTIPARFGLIWLGGFRGEDLNVIQHYIIWSLHWTLFTNTLAPLTRIIQSLYYALPHPAIVPIEGTVFFYQNMPNLHNRYKSAERKISHKNLTRIIQSLYPTKLDQTWQGWSLGRSLPKLCPIAMPSIQDGRHY
jgi:hypothetical protein